MRPMATAPSAMVVGFTPAAVIALRFWRRTERDMLKGIKRVLTAR